MEKSLFRIREQAEQSGFFDKINVLCERDLPEDFKEKWKDQLVLGSRGYGYWIWKSFLISEHLKNMQDNDILLYCDCGSHINPNSRDMFNHYLELTNECEAGILGFALGGVNYLGSGFLEYIWTKSDLLYHFDVLGNKDIILSPQIEANTIFIKKNTQSVKIIDTWYSVYEEDFNLVNDTPSKIPNYIGFNEHRHDQSIFSILGKLNNIRILDSFGNTFPTSGRDWDELYHTRCCPVLARRDKS